MPSVAECSIYYFHDTCVRVRTSRYDAGLWIHSSIPNLYVTSHVDDFKVHGRSEEDCDWFLTLLGQRIDINERLWLFHINFHMNPVDSRTPPFDVSAFHERY